MTRNNLLLSSLLFFIGLGLHAEDYPDFHTIVGSLPNDGTVSLPKNTYRLDLAGKGTFRVTDKKNLHIDGNGSTIICNKQINAFYFRNCENVTFSNLHIEYDPPCSTQGTITKITNGNQTLEVEIHKGYPMVNPSIKQNSILIYDSKTRELVRNFHTTHATSAIQVNNETRRVTFDIWSKDGVYEVGDYVDFNNVVGGGQVILTEYCKNMKYQGITIYDSPGMAFVEGGCENTHYFQCEINREKNYPGRPQDRLRSARADCFHCKNDIVGPTIEECIAKYQGDDVVNISGYFSPVYKVDKIGKKIYVLSTTHKASDISVKNNDNIVCINNDGTIRGKGVISNITDASVPSEGEKKACLTTLTKIREEPNLNYGVSIALKEWIEGVEVGDMIYSSDRVGSGFQLLNNDVGHNRSRAFLIKASNGKIQGNKITGSAMSAIAVTPEFFWLEAGCSSNLEISNNIIKDCMFDEYLIDFAQAGAITVACQAPNGALAKAGAFENISIHDNTIIGCPMPCIFLNAVASGYYYGNKLKPDSKMVRNHGRDLGIKNTEPYLEINVGNIIKEKP